MKNTCLKPNSGSVLVGALIFVLLIAFFLYSYLWIVSNSNQSTARAQRWNSALAVAESGIEEGLANLNSGLAFTTYSNALLSPIPLTNNLTIANYVGSYSVTDATNGMTNTITSTGFVPSPTPGDTSIIRRTVQVSAQRSGLFTKGIISMTSILASGNGVLVDSYDSLLGPYNAATAGTNGNVAALLNGTVDLGNHTIDGSLAMSSDTTLASSPRQIKGRVITNWVMELPDVTLPTTDANGNPLPGMWPSAPGDPTSHTFQNSGYYTLRDRGNLTVAAGVTVTLDVKVSSFSLSASAITINGGTTNAGTLIIYQESGSVSLGGSASGGAVNNRPINFQYFGLPGVTSITMSGDSKFTGVIYAPEADMTLNGGGSSPDLMGSFIVHSWTDKGHYIVHYDTSLAGYYYGYFVVDSWQELSPAAN